ncbi:MAG: hypothetical protein ACI9CV_001453 [Ilumatobacter sp.]|jgi:hypothetical protein
MPVNSNTPKFTGLSPSNPQGNVSKVETSDDRGATHGAAATTDLVGSLGEDALYL